MRTVALEEHFVTESFLRATQNSPLAHPQLAQLRPKLLDLGAGRIAAMDESAIDFQILSLAALGFDAFDLKDPASAAKELERCVTELGFHGACFNGTISAPLSGTVSDATGNTL